VSLALLAPSPQPLTFPKSEWAATSTSRAALTLPARAPSARKETVPLGATVIAFGKTTSASRNRQKPAPTDHSPTAARNVRVSKLATAATARGNPPIPAETSSPMTFGRQAFT